MPSGRSRRWCGNPPRWTDRRLRFRLGHPDHRPSRQGDHANHRPVVLRLDTERVDRSPAPAPLQGTAPGGAFDRSGASLPPLRVGRAVPRQSPCCTPDKRNALCRSGSAVVGVPATRRRARDAPDQLHGLRHRRRQELILQGGRQIGRGGATERAASLTPGPGRRTRALNGMRRSATCGQQLVIVGIFFDGHTAAPSLPTTTRLPEEERC